MKNIFLLVVCISFSVQTFSQEHFFMESWQPKAAEIPINGNVTKTTNPSNVNVTFDFGNEITKISPYLYGHCVSQFYGNYYSNPTLLKNIKNLNPNILRYPAGSGSNYFYWNRYETDGAPADASVTKFKWGMSNEPNFMSNENFYNLCEQTNSAGINVVNYSYARYGTSQNPVAVAAHLAADWVRYDNGKTKFWEIGNENYGAWEEGYEIDVTQNKDEQPRFQTGTLYGEHFKVFADSMRKAANEIGATIKLGAVCYSDNQKYTWNDEVIQKVGNVADFLIVHEYFGQKNENGNYAQVLALGDAANEPIDAIRSKLNQYGFSNLPVALTEWNMNYELSGQKVSYLSGMFGVITLGNIIKSGYGLATRWNLVWKYQDALTHGLFTGDKELADEGLSAFQPRPAFFYQYYFQKFFGDKMIACTSSDNNLVAFTSSFSSGQAGIILVNRSLTKKTVKINSKNFVAGQKYYWYLLTGDTNDGSFSRKLFINGYNNQTVSGPTDYENVKAFACEQSGGVLIDLPALSTAFVLLDGNNSTGIEDLEQEMFNDFTIYPNPASDFVNFEVNLYEKSNIQIEIFDFIGKKIDEIKANDLETGKHSFSWDNFQNRNSQMLFVKFTKNNQILYKLLAIR